jgi:hypothetical protein
MARLTNKEIDILVKKLTREVKEASLQKLEKYYKKAEDDAGMIYPDIIALHKSWLRAKNNVEDLRKRLDEMRKNFNSISGEDWKLDIDLDGNLSWYYNGARHYNALEPRIQEELVYQMIDKENDMEAVTKAIVNKFSI